MLFANKDEVAAELKCGICHLPWAPESAKACPTCDTLFCETCLSDHYQKDSKCPACTTDIPDFASLRSAPRPLRSMAERSVIVKCPNRPATCWSGPWGQLASHLKDCPFNPDLVVYAEEIPDELQCAICLNVLDSPVTAPCCEQTFCNKCITASLSKRAECPHCRAALSDALLTEPRQSLTKMINRLKVRCPSQCGWVGEKAHVTAHLPLCTERVVVSAPVETTRAAPPAAAEPAPAVVTPAPAAAVAAVPAAAVAVPPAPTVASGPAIAMTTRNYHATVHESNTIVPFYTMAHIKAASAPETSERKHLQISAVMDISGSMGTDKMRMAKEALKFVVNELKPTDRFGLIAFDDKVEARLPLTDMSRLGQANAEAAINGLVARGGTNLSSGLFAGIAQVRDMPFVNPRAARHIDATRSPPPAAAVNSNATTSSGILSRLANLATRKPQATPRSSVVTPPPSVFDDQDELYASQATAASLYIPAFPVTVKYTTAQCKRNNDWMTRYTFEVASTLPRGVAHVSVRHPTHGKITLRGPATFGLLPSGLTDFFVDVVFDREVNHTESIPITLTVDEDGVGQTTVTTQAYGTAPVPRTRIVMLFTDGQANEGITNPTELTDRTNAILAKMPEKDVTVITFGFGSDHNGALLSLIAEKSQGTYYYVENSARIKEVFADCIGGLLSIMATELTLTIKPALGIRISEVMTLFPKMPPAADGSVVVKMKDIFADEERDIVVQVDVAPRGVCPAVPIVTWTLRYEQAGLPGQQQVLSVDSAVATIDRPFLGSPDAQVDEQINRYRAAHAMAEAQRLAEEGRVNEANVALRAVQACVQTSASANTAYTTRLQSDLDRAVAATASASTWAREGQKQVSRMKSTHAQQRCNVAEDDDEDMYVTKAKVAMRKNARS